MSKLVKLNFKDQTLIINTRGGGIAEYYVTKKNQRRDIVYGYGSEKDYDGGMGDVLSPFPGRVENSEYYFNGNHYKLSGFNVNSGNALHVFVREQNWKVEVTDKNKITASFNISSKKFSKHGYPFDLELTIIYSLSNNGLTVSTKVKNIGPETAPFGIGYHPYFKVAAKVDDMVWIVPAKKIVEFDEKLKPTGRLLVVSKTEFDFRIPKEIGSLEIDNCFTDLIRDKKGIFTSTLSNKSGSEVIKVWQDKKYPYFQTYSADTIAKKNFRQAMALEPQTCCGYAVNVPNLGLIKLKPKEEFNGCWGIQLN